MEVTENIVVIFNRQVIVVYLTARARSDELALDGPIVFNMTPEGDLVDIECRALRAPRKLLPRDFPG